MSVRKPCEMQTNETDVLDAFPVGCLVTAPDRTVRYACAYLRDLLARSGEQLTGLPLDRLLTGGSRALLETYVVPLLAQYGRFDEMLLQMVDANGHAVPVLANGRIDGPSGETRWSIVSAAERDRLYQELVTARRSLEERAAELAVRAATDFVTGLTSRAEFDRHADMMIARAGRAGQPVTLMLIDIDAFKLINDRLGHRAGDEVLRAIGPALRDAVRDGDIVARYGGDEFALILDNADEADAEAVAARIHEAVRGLDAGGNPTTVSIGGVAILDSEDRDFRDLYAVADGALYKAKRQGRDRAVIERLG